MFPGTIRICMPTIEIQTNVEVNQTAAQNIKSALGQIITCIPGKTESGLMVLVEDKLRMWFRGSDETPMAIVEVKIFGNQVDKEGAQNMTREVCALLEKELYKSQGYLRALPGFA